MMPTAGQEELLILLKYNLTLNKLKKLSKWHMESLGNLEEIDSMLVIEKE
jgi:hypothetical protein